MIPTTLDTARRGLETTSASLATMRRPPRHREHVISAIESTADGFGAVMNFRR